MTTTVLDNFAYYLAKPIADNIIDLSSATLVDCINTMIKIKSSISINCRKRHSCLLYNLASLQTEFNCTLAPQHVTDIFWNYLVAYLIERKKLSVSTIKTVCSQLKTALQWAARHNAKVSSTYDILKIPSYCHEQIALTPDEVSHIYHFDVDSIPRRPQYRDSLKRIKDAFVLACNLGQRHSDMIRIDKSCFNRNIFTMLQQKTGIKIYVDIDKFALDKNTIIKIH